MNARDDLADWVKPIAESIERGAVALLEFARSRPAKFWEAPSALEGWTRKDLLAHLAGDTGRLSTRLMRAAVTGTPLAVGSDLRDGGDAANAADVAARRSDTVAQLIDEIERERALWRDLLPRLRVADEHARWPDFPLTLGAYLRHCADHDLEHLAHFA